jgi:hypothetical protein
LKFQSGGGEKRVKLFIIHYENGKIVGVKKWKISWIFGEVEK